MVNRQMYFDDYNHHSNQIDILFKNHEGLCNEIGKQDEVLAALTRAMEKLEETVKALEQRIAALEKKIGGAH